MNAMLMYDANHVTLSVGTGLDRNDANAFQPGTQQVVNFSNFAVKKQSPSNTTPTPSR